MPLFKRSNDSEQKKKIYSEDEIKQRLETMSPEMQNTFIRMAETLLHKESQMFLGIVAQSRQDIQDVGHSIKEEQEVLKTTAKLLARERTGDAADFAEQAEGGKTQIHFESEYNKKAVADYLRAVGREAPSQTTGIQKRRNYRFKQAAQQIPEYARRVGTVSPEHRPMTAASNRPSTAYRMRMLGAEEDEAGAVGGAAAGGSTATVREVQEAPVVDEKVKEEKEELMEHMKRMDTALMSEKERQQEAIRARKEARKAKKEAKMAEDQSKAQELMESNQEAEEQKRKNKERQEQILKERLAKKKLERRKTLQDLEVDSGEGPSGLEKANEMESELGITRAKTSLDPSEEAAKKKGKKNQKKEEAVPQPVEADWGAEGAAETKKPKKGKKKKDQVADEEAQPNDVEGAGEDGKKKKKKKKKKPAEETVLDLEEPAAAPEQADKKKKKKKKLESLDMSVSEV